MMTAAIAVAIRLDLLTDLPGNLVWDLCAVLPWDLSAHLTWDFEWDLSGDLFAVFTGNFSASSLSNVSDKVLALSSWNVVASWSLDKTLGLNWNLLADAINLGLASWCDGETSGVWSTGNCNTVWNTEELSISIGLGFGFAFVDASDGDWSNAGGDWGGNTGENWAGNTGESWAGSTGENWTGVSSDGDWGGDTTDGNGWLGNVLDSDLTLDTDQMSLFAVPSFDISALISVSGVDDSVALGVANLLVMSGTSPVWNLTSHWVALSLAGGVASGVELGSDLSFGNSLASLFVSLCAFGAVSGIVDSLANWMRSVLMDIRSGRAVASPPVTAVTSMTTVAVLTTVSISWISLSLWLANGQWGDQAQQNQILVHFFFKVKST